MISFFAKSTYLLTDKEKGKAYLQRVSTRIRVEEISEYLEARLNPTEGYENDVCIYVKPDSFDQIKDGAYIDILDDAYAVKSLKDRPRLKVIAMSASHYDHLKKELPNEITLIPHHHINFERATRTRKEIKVCGYVGPLSAFHRYESEGLKGLFEQLGLKFEPLFYYQTRQDIIDYYQTIDIQVIAYFNYHDRSPYRHPTKIFNAASFGIPTIAALTNGYKEAKHYYVPVNDMRHLRKEVNKMQREEQYKVWTDRVAKKAEEYHISKIAKLYKNLR